MTSNDKSAPDLSAYVDLTEEEVLGIISNWPEGRGHLSSSWSTDDELVYVLVTSLVRKHFKEAAE